MEHFEPCPLNTLPFIVANRNMVGKKYRKNICQHILFPSPPSAVILCHGSVGPIYHMQLPAERVKFKPCCALYGSVIFSVLNNRKIPFQLKFQRSQATHSIMKVAIMMENGALGSNFSLSLPFYTGSCLRQSEN